MEEFSRISDQEMKPHLLDLIPIQRETLVSTNESTNHEDKKLDLSLAPPGQQEDDDSLSYLSKTITCGTKRGFIDTLVNKEEAWILNNNKLLDLQVAEKKGLSSVSATANNNTAVPNTPMHKRVAPVPVVGWPPIRSFRKNITSGSTSKLPIQQQDVIQNKVTTQKQTECCHKGLFVKINMDGVPIGRKVDLKAYDSYEKLSSAVDQLFRELVAAQLDSTCVGGIKKKQEGEKAITGLLDGSGEYTLVYEDNEGDMVLVGDVPWHMFVSTVKRLRVLRSCEVSTLFCGIKKEKNSANVALRI